MQPIHPCDWPDIVDRSDDRRQAEQAARHNHVDCLNGLPATGYTIITTPIREYRIHVADIYCKDDGWLIIFDRYRRHTGERLRATGAGTLRQTIDFTASVLDMLYPERDEREYRRD